MSEYTLTANAAAQLEWRREQIELGERLFQCSPAPAGRVMRKWIEKQIKQIDKNLEK